MESVRDGREATAIFACTTISTLNELIQDKEMNLVVEGAERVKNSEPSHFLLWILGQNSYSRWFYSTKNPQKLYLCSTSTWVPCIKNFMTSCARMPGLEGNVPSAGP